MAATVTDLIDRIIPNQLVLIVLCCGLVLRLMSGPGPLLVSMLTAMAVLAVLGSLAVKDLIGWGDAKLITAVTLAVPAASVISLLLAIALAGGLLSCIYLILRVAQRRPISAPHHGGSVQGRGYALRRLASRERARILANEPMPYALAVFGGAAYGLAAG